MKYDKEITDRICKSLVELKGRVKSAEEAGISYETFTQWLKKPEFSEAIKKAEQESRENGKGIAIMSIFQAMPDSWQAAAWWLERQHEEFIKKEKNELTGKDGEALKISVVNYGNQNTPQLPAGTPTVSVRSVERPKEIQSNSGTPKSGKDISGSK